MKRFAFVLALLILPALASAQMSMNFVTTAKPSVVKPGNVVTLTAELVHGGMMPMQVLDDGIFLVGLRYSQPGPFPYGMFVDPALPFAIVKFKEIKRGNYHVHQAILRLPVPNMTLPPNFMADFYFQCVAIVKPYMLPQQLMPMPSLAAKVTLVAP